MPVTGRPSPSGGAGIMLGSRAIASSASVPFVLRYSVSCRECQASGVPIHDVASAAVIRSTANRGLPLELRAVAIRAAHTVP